MNNTLNLSIRFKDADRNFLFCGELAELNLLISSPEFTNQKVISDFISRIGATVESIEIVNEFPNSQASNSQIPSSSSSLASMKQMKSVESVSNLLRSPIANSSGDSGSQRSMTSISSVTARRFAALNTNRRESMKAKWIEEDSLVTIPFTTFIDSEMLSSTCHRAALKIKVSLSELVSVDSLDLENDNDADNKNADIKSLGQRLQKIGESEIVLTLLRPLHVSLRTHPLSPRQSLLQINIHHDNQPENCEIISEQQQQQQLHKSIEILKVDLIVQSDNCSYLTSTNPIYPNQFPFTFESPICFPQTRSILYHWNLLSTNGAFDNDENISNDEFLTLRVELTGRLAAASQMILSFESAISPRLLFPKHSIKLEGIQITESKIINSDAIKVLEAFQIEFILKNYHSEVQSVNFAVDQPLHPSKLNPKIGGSGIKEWLKLEKFKKSPSLLLTAPLAPLKIDNLPPGGSKALRIQFVPTRRGIFHLKDEFTIYIDESPVPIGISYIKVE